ncbi:hypothetical protein, partial [Methylobacterium nigriterrae]|uniref:hypothetical protein n=1 Tax=Methylobacterium nigriterrae TaxID=3127512 RepID=UPI003013C68F
SFLHSASSSITPPSQEEQNARTRNTFKAEQAVVDGAAAPSPALVNSIGAVSARNEICASILSLTSWW